VSTRILIGDCRLTLPTLPERSVRCCVTSPPYWGLRDYGHGEQIGRESTPDAYVEQLVAVFREVRRVLTDDGTLWLNLGDSYSFMRDSKATPDTLRGDSDGTAVAGAMNRNPAALHAAGLKHKDLVGIPWRVAFALQADGWYLRSDIIWQKPNPMPESVTDRPTKAHEYVFLLSKSAKYYYDAAAISEAVAPATVARLSQDVESQEGSQRVPGKTNGAMKAVAPRFGGSKYGNSDAKEHRTKSGNVYDLGDATRNARTVWSITTRPFSGAHFATMPPELAERCVKAGSAIRDIILDPFGGAGTTALVADRLGRDAVLCELNPAYAGLAEQRVTNDNPLFSEVIR
jgi:DNA modification methylase